MADVMRAELGEDGLARILRSEDECVGLSLPTTGPGSHAELVEYVREVLQQNTVLKPGYNPAGSFDKLARGTVYSILHRLNIGWASAETDPRQTE